MTTWLLRLEPQGSERDGDQGTDTGPRLAVKDLIDVMGTPTTCASRPVAAAALPAWDDAACVDRARARGARIIGKTNLHELAFGGTGVNPFTGTPVNPLRSDWIPGGSSSGSAVAVATGEADIALGTDTGGSIRTPAACCGIVGLKTTFGRIPVDGVRPLAPSLDTVGPMAATVDGVAAGLALIDSSFAASFRSGSEAAATAPAESLGRFRLHGVAPFIEDAIDALLAVAEVPVGPAELPSWDLADRAGSTVAFVEASRVHAQLLLDNADELGDEVRDRLVRGRAISSSDYDGALALADPWRHELELALARTPVLAMAAIMDDPAPLDDPLRLDTRRPNVAVNLAGNPAIVLPVPIPGRLPTAVQLVAGHGREDLLLATARVLEAAATSMR